MKVVHFESGLGNQMLDYVDYLMIRRANPMQEVYMERLAFDIAESHKAISMWNGFELDRVFNITIPDIQAQFDGHSWEVIKSGLRESRFWEHGWTISDELVSLFSEQGLHLKNSLLRPAPLLKAPTSPARLAIRSMRRSRLGGVIRGAMSTRRQRTSDTRILYSPNEESELCGHSLMAMFNGYGIDELRQEVLDAFRFPAFTDQRNQAFAELIRSRNVVSIHARRGDYMGVNGFCYKNGFFKRATTFMKRSTEAPLFVFFSDPSSVPWISENLRTFGLDEDVDDFRIVDWNSGLDSYRDMQLMSLCNHNIITQSSFGWWASYLNTHPNKVTIAPVRSMIATYCM